MIFEDFRDLVSREGIPERILTFPVQMAHGGSSGDRWIAWWRYVTSYMICYRASDAALSPLLLDVRLGDPRMRHSSIRIQRTVDWRAREIIQLDERTHRGSIDDRAPAKIRVAITIK